ncbi:MAG: hypothetical protein KGY54_13210 [Oleiphilaceae bacterium]|nr:hypothetical protein [Oleiphilaceae bacterium]
MTGSSKIDDCLDKTDTLLYKAKERGRNCTACEPE